MRDDSKAKGDSISPRFLGFAVASAVAIVFGICTLLPGNESAGDALSMSLLAFVCGAPLAWLAATRAMAVSPIMSVALILVLSAASVGIGAIVLVVEMTIANGLSVDVVLPGIGLFAWFGLLFALPLPTLCWCAWLFVMRLFARRVSVSRTSRPVLARD